MHQFERNLGGRIASSPYIRHHVAAMVTAVA